MNEQTIDARNFAQVFTKANIDDAGTLLYGFERVKSIVDVPSWSRRVRVPGTNRTIVISLKTLIMLLIVAAYFFWPAEAVAQVFGMFGHMVNGSMLSTVIVQITMDQVSARVKYGIRRAAYA